MKAIIAIALFIVATITAKAQQNTILIIADDLSPDYFSFSPDAKDTAITPNINALAANGIRFTSAWANPYCAITRGSILTGRYPFRSNGSAHLDTTEMSIARLLKYYAPVNYNTACVGKWHLTRDAITETITYPNIIGFNLYSGCIGGEVPSYYSYPRITNGIVDTVNIYATTQTVNDVAGWLDTINTAQPFFLWLAFNAPHVPYHKPPNSLITNTGLSGTTYDISHNTKEYFKATVEAMDTEIGRLLQYLAANNLMDSTNIIFVGDNGNSVKTAQIANTARAKGTLYDYGVHVPYIIKGPAVVNPGRASNALVSTTDLYATIAELGGVVNWVNYIPSNRLPIDSRSLLPIIKNQATSIRTWNFSDEISEPADDRDGKSIRNDNYHLIRFDNGIEELYKVAVDTFELNELLSGSPTPTDMSNYYSLCDSLSAVIASPHHCSMPTCSTSVSISATATSICSGTPITFTAVSINGGATPVYNWYINGSLVSSSNTFTSSTLINADRVSCEMISSISCALYYKAVSNAITITVNPIVTPSVVISTASTSICSGSNVQFLATAINGGTAPFYQWTKNGNNTGTNSNSYSDTGLSNNDVISCIVTSNGVCLTSPTPTSDSLVITVSAYVVQSVAISSSSSSICSGNNVDFTATATNGGTAPSYQWKKNGINTGNNTNSYSDTALSNNDTVNCVLTSSEACVTTSTATSNTVTTTVNPNAVPLVVVNASQTSICAGTNIIFTAAPTNGGTSPVFQWKKNGIETGTNSNSYSDSTLSNNDVISCVMATNEVCATASSVISNEVTITDTSSVIPSLIISTPSATICTGTNVTFIATPTNGGISPVYQWRKNGNDIGTNLDSYSDNLFVDGDVVSCIMTSNAACLTTMDATSNSVTMTVNAGVNPSIAITSSATSICQGTNVAFNAATTNEGTLPTYQWKKNGSNVGSNLNSYTDNAPANNDMINCVLTSNAACVSQTTVPSNSIAVTVNPNITPSVVVSTPSTSICKGANVVFTASVSNGGAAPNYQWKKNGINVGTNLSTYTVNTLENNNIISCMITSNAACLITPTATSNSVIMSVSSVVPSKPKAITGPANNLCSTTTAFIYSIPSVSGATTYTWTVPSYLTIVTGQGTTSITISRSSLFLSGTISVVATNACGVSASRTLVVYAKPPAPGVINGSAVVCPGQQNVPYSVGTVTGATSYKWTVPTGAVIKSGKNTKSIVVNFGNNAGSITVLAKNSCANSSKSTLPVTINCRMSNDLNQNLREVKVLNPFDRLIDVDANFDFDNVQLILYDYTGREILQLHNLNFKAGEKKAISIEKDLPAGIYFLSLESPLQSFKIKLIHK